MKTSWAGMVAIGGLAACGFPVVLPAGGDGGDGSDATIGVGVDAPPDPCANGQRDGTETDVDCGGTCGPCGLGRSCAVDADCGNTHCAPATNTCLSLAGVTFAAPVLYPSGYKAYFVRAGDLDGDGDVDAVVGNEQANAVAVFLNTGAGAFHRLAEFTTGDYPTGGAIADVDDDGVADVVTADYHGDSVSVLRGAGGGALAAGVAYPTIAGGETSNLAVGDLDGDDILDVIATNPQRASASVYLGRGDGTLAAAPSIVFALVGMAEPYSVAIGDFDGDGRADAAFADDATSRVRVRLGNGDGTFHEGATVAIGGTRSFIVVAHDMNLDGALDLVVANRNSDDVSVILGPGDGDFSPAIVTGTGAGTGPYSLAVADFNLDGVPDVATANYASSTASVLLGRGDGGFEALVDIGTTGVNSYGVAAADFDGDGKPDLAIANAVSNDLAILLNTSD
jgi:hypothetical protein